MGSLTFKDQLSVEHQLLLCLLVSMYVNIQLHVLGIIALRIDRMSEMDTNYFHDP